MLHKPLFKLVLVFLLTLPLFGAPNLRKIWNNMTDRQRASIYHSYITGKPYDIGYTLAAINWQESVGGLYQISTDHHDFGVYHINIIWYLKENRIKNTMWTRSKYSTLIITHPNYSELYVISKIMGLLRANDNNFFKTWWRYNGSETYAVHILRKVVFLKKVFKLRY